MDSSCRKVQSCCSEVSTFPLLAQETLPPDFSGIIFACEGNSALYNFKSLGCWIS